jgi:hypothetical protein
MSRLLSLTQTRALFNKLQERLLNAELSFQIIFCSFDIFRNSKDVKLMKLQLVFKSMPFL